jgi:hypothetical protein
MSWPASATGPVYEHTRDPHRDAPRSLHLDEVADRAAQVATQLAGAAARLEGVTSAPLYGIAPGYALRPDQVRVFQDCANYLRQASQGSTGTGVRSGVSFYRRGQARR